MSTYARIDHGIVVEIIGPYVDQNGTEVPIGQRYTAAFVQTLVDVTGISPAPAQRWTYDGKNFSAPS